MLPNAPKSTPCGKAKCAGIICLCWFIFCFCMVCECGIQRIYGYFFYSCLCKYVFVSNGFTGFFVNSFLFPPGRRAAVLDLFLILICKSVFSSSFPLFLFSFSFPGFYLLSLENPFYWSSRNFFLSLFPLALQCFYAFTPGSVKFSEKFCLTRLNRDDIF